MPDTTTCLPEARGIKLFLATFFSVCRNKLERVAATDGRRDDYLVSERLPERGHGAPAAAMGRHYLLGLKCFHVIHRLGNDFFQVPDQVWTSKHCVDGYLGEVGSGVKQDVDDASVRASAEHNQTFPARLAACALRFCL
jgi:hypothetical protein